MENRHSRAASIALVWAGACLLCVAGWGIQAAPASASPAEPEPQLGGDAQNPVLRFAVAHGHTMGFCVGYLYISRDKVRYQAVSPASDRGHSFEVSRSEVAGMGHWKLSFGFGFGPKNWAALKLRSGTQYSFMLVLPKHVVSGGTGAREEALPYTDLVEGYNNFDDVVARTQARDARLRPPPAPAPPPTISLLEPAGVGEGRTLEAAGATFHVHGIAAQSSGISSVSVNQQMASLKPLTPQTVEFEVTGLAMKPGINPVVVEAVAADQARAQLAFRVQRPEVRILEPVPESQTPKPSTRVRGQVLGLSGVDRVELAGQAATTRNLEGGAVEFEVAEVPLSLGPNSLPGFVSSRSGAREDFTVAVTRVAPAGPPALTLAEIEDALKKRLPAGRIQSLVTQYGVDFALTDEAEKRLRAAGADSDLLLTIAKSKK